jgi:hypothetical protein
MLFNLQVGAVMSNCRIVFVAAAAMVFLNVSGGAQTPSSPATQVAENSVSSPVSTAATSSSSAADAPAAIIASPPALPEKNNSNKEIRIRPFSRFAVGTKLGTLGWGGQIATPILRRMNLRGGFDLFNLGYGLTSDGTDYYASAHLKSGTVQADIYPFAHGSFHISPGVLIFKNSINAALNVPGGNSFSVGNADYTSDPSDPVHGTGTILFSRSTMPMLTIGFGNMIPRRESRHLSVPFEIGAAYTGHDTIQINMQGSVCQQGQGCGSTNDPSFQQNVQDQQAKINEQLKRIQIYPVLTTGLTYRF